MSPYYVKAALQPTEEEAPGKQTLASLPLPPTKKPHTEAEIQAGKRKGKRPKQEGCKLFLFEAALGSKGW